MITRHDKFDLARRLEALPGDGRLSNVLISVHSSSAGFATLCLAMTTSEGMSGSVGVSVPVEVVSLGREELVESPPELVGSGGVDLWLR
jgi:hypothetical protein